jgi:hypothetical protein
MVTLLRKMIVEAAERFGTAIGATLAALGIASEDISILVAAVPVVLGVLFDIAIKSYFGGRAK